MKKIVLSVVAFAALSLTSCSSDDQVLETQATNDFEFKATAALCDVTSTSVTVNRIASPSSTYTNWQTVPVTINGELDIQFEGIYGGSIRPADPADNWYVGTVPLDSTCEDWDIWNTDITVKNTNSVTVGSSPSNPYNVLGYNGMIGTDNYGLGYYSYNILTHVMTPARAIVIWKDNSGGGSDSYYSTNAASSPSVYLIKVTGIVPGSSGSTTNSTINYNWTKVQ
ncbi:hypothetical protein V1389_01360 [Flavobacterium rakeshii]|uniref:hypothetical protein n=1 Tax=Flavobacterium rakeshii TaxID=1038845 RepID=UPI002E7B5299|nr:hypothetical protein [Flavobacterium rakeshii]MEE1896964.1 hypothetical protein [Flavobacterium rakeshii]